MTTTPSNFFFFFFFFFDFEKLTVVCSLKPFQCGKGAKERPSAVAGETDTDDEAVRSIRGKNCRILVVDDEDRFRGSLIFKLKNLYGADVEEAYTGPMALETVESRRGGFNLILMDISMPGMTGIEACKAMRERGVKTPIVLMSAYFSDENQKEAQSLDIALIHKPIDKHVLQNILLECGGTNLHD